MIRTTPYPDNALPVIPSRSNATKKAYSPSAFTGDATGSNVRVTNTAIMIS